MGDDCMRVEFNQHQDSKSNIDYDDQRSNDSLDSKEYETDITDLSIPFESLLIHEALTNLNDETENHAPNKDTAPLFVSPVAVSKRRVDDISNMESSPLVGEGFRSPYNHLKRLDLNPTPIHISNPPVRRPIGSATSFSSPASKEFILKEPLDTPCSHSRQVVTVFVAEGDHDTGEHQENFMRMSLITGESGCLHRPKLFDHVHIIDKCNRLPSLADLLRVHDYAYIRHLETKAREVIDTSVRANIPGFYAPAGQLDADTPLGLSSLEAAKKFCGAAMSAIDLVMDKNINQSKRVLVLGRPPGHHAGPNGCVVSNHYWKRPDMTSSGFCLLNTVAVAAGYARYKYGSGPETSPPRIAIIDIDVHHGNGTEEIVRNLRPHHIYLPLPSSWAPIQQLSYRPWLNEQDADETLFASINLVADDRFYPCSGQDSESKDSHIINVALSPIGPGPWDQKGRLRLSAKEKSQLCARASCEFRSKVCAQLLPRLREFGANLILISAGFDAHVDDFYHFLNEDDFHWITSEIVAISEVTNSPVVSILEGGYSLSAPPQSGISRKNAKTPVDAAEMFAQLPGDGGLVKGVLAHAAALADRKSW